MNRVKIEYELKRMFDTMMQSFDGLYFKYEYSEERHTFLVAALIDEDRDDYEDYCSMAIREENRLNQMFGDDAPLFSDNGTLFKLSAKATVVSLYKHGTTSTIQFPSHMIPMHSDDWWSPVVKAEMKSDVDKKFDRRAHVSMLYAAA